MHSRENKGTERDNQGFDWDMSIPLKLFLTLEAVCFPRRPHGEFSIKKYLFLSFTKSVIFIDKTNLHAVHHFIAFVQNIRLWLVEMRTSRKTDFRSRDIAKYNCSGIDISQGLDLELPSLSPYFLSVHFNCSLPVKINSLLATIHRLNMIYFIYYL